MKIVSLEMEEKEDKILRQNINELRKTDEKDLNEQLDLYDFKNINNVDLNIGELQKIYPSNAQFSNLENINNSEYFNNFNDFKKDFNDIVQKFEPKLFRLVHPEYGVIYLLGSQHNQHIELTDQVCNLIKQSDFFVCESTDVALRLKNKYGSSNKMDLELLDYTLQHTAAHIFSLESAEEQDALGQKFEEGMNKEEFDKELLFDRNEVMVNRLIERLSATKNQSAFVVVGQEHLTYSNFVGGKSMVELLEEKKFTSEQVELREELCFLAP